MSDEEGGSVWRGENPRSVMWAPVLVAISIVFLLVWLLYGWEPALGKDDFDGIDAFLVQAGVSFLTGLAIWFGLAYSLRNLPFERRVIYALGAYAGIGVLIALLTLNFEWRHLLFWPSYVYHWILCEGMNKCLSAS